MQGLVGGLHVAFAVGDDQGEIRPGDDAGQRLVDALSHVPDRRVVEAAVVFLDEGSRRHGEGLVAAAPPPPVAAVATGSLMLVAAAWLRSTVIQGCGVSRPSVSRVRRVRIGSATVVSSSFHVPPAGTTIGGPARG